MHFGGVMMTLTVLEQNGDLTWAAGAWILVLFLAGYIVGRIHSRKSPSSSSSKAPPVPNNPYRTPAPLAETPASRLEELRNREATTTYDEGFRAGVVFCENVADKTRKTIADHAAYSCCARTLETLIHSYRAMRGGK